MPRKPGGYALAVLMLAHIVLPVAAQALSKGKSDLRVMNYNINEGTDFSEIAQATNQQEFLIAVGQTITQVRATNPPQRMQAVATQILAVAPTLVSVEEVDQWYTGPFDPSTQTCGSTTLEFDMLPELLHSLAVQGGHYQVAVQALQYAYPPTPGTDPAQHLDLRAGGQLQRDPGENGPRPRDLPVEQSTVRALRLHSLSQQSYWRHTGAESLGVGRRAVQQPGFCFIGTDLDATDANVRALQAGELRSGPANTALPVIIAMDANAQAAPLPQDAACLDFLAAGYNDAWSDLFSNVSGFTCCQTELDNNPVSELFTRIDLILTHGPVEVQNIALFGADAASKTADGLWPSDHAGIAAQVSIEKE